MRRFFSAFPDGGPGVGLLLLRLVAGVTGVIQGAMHVTMTTSPTLADWMVGALATVTGAAVLVGYFTPGAAVVLGLSIPLFWFPARAESLFFDRFGALLIVTNAAAIAFLGPGAFSIDARRFGHREILIRPESRSSGF